MIAKHTFKNVFWIDIESPVAAELIACEEEHLLPETFFVTQQDEPFISHPDFLFLQMHEYAGPETIQPINVLLTKNGLYTYHMHPLSIEHPFRNIFSIDSPLENSHTDTLLPAKLLLLFLQAKIDTIGTKIQQRDFKVLGQFEEQIQIAEIQLKELYTLLLKTIESTEHVLLPHPIKLNQLILQTQSHLFAIKEIKFKYIEWHKAYAKEQAKENKRLRHTFKLSILLLAFIIIFAILIRYYGLTYL